MFVSVFYPFCFSPLIVSLSRWCISFCHYFLSFTSGYVQPEQYLSFVFGSRCCYLRWLLLLLLFVSFERFFQTLVRCNVYGKRKHNTVRIDRLYLFFFARALVVEASRKGKHDRETNPHGLCFWRERSFVFFVLFLFIVCLRDKTCIHTHWLFEKRNNSEK
jgi:hypothetical protein